MTLGDKRYLYSTHEAPGGLALSGTLHRATFPLRLQARPLSSPPASAGRRGSPEKPGRGHPEHAGTGGAQPAAPALPAGGDPAPALPRRPGRSAPGYLRASGGGWLLAPTRRPRPSTHSLPSTGLRPHHQGPETGQQTGLQFLRRHHRGARTRNRARAAAQVMLGSVSSSGLGAGEACAARLFPAAYSGCKETVCVCF